MERLKTYVAGCEFITETESGIVTEKSWTFLTCPTGVFAVVEKQGDTETLHYILKDHQGSWMVVTDAEGAVEQELSYDAWGNLRDPDTWCVDTSIKPMFDRGYTGQEHLTVFGLVNMNGRCYDPLTSSFLSVDAYVQDPTSAQSFNRYAYCMHNPLRYTDPTGWLSEPGRSDSPNLNHSHDESARWQSEDINDVLWGRSVHPCETGNPYWTNSTFTTYTQGNESDRCNTQLSCLSKPIKTEEGYYLNILNGRIEYSPGGENLLYNDGLLYMTSLDATIGDIEDVLNRWNLSYTTDPNIEGRYLVNTETYIKGWMLWRSMPVMATYFAGMTVESFISAISQIKNAKYYTVEPKKYDYFFGKVASNSHNATRSIQNEKALRELGITNKQQINRIFDRAITEGNIIKTQTTNYGTVITRQVEIGKSGCIDVGFFYENSNMLSIPKVITIIPKIY